jgi:hypothetical protein
MPSSTMREESAYPLPEDVLFPAELTSVVVRTVEFTYKKGPKVGEKGSFDLWVWEFAITGGDYAGMKAWGETEDNLNNLEEPKGRAKLVRPWAETLLGRQIEIGENFDTDQVLGLPCKITVKHEEPRPKKDGGFFYGCPVEDVFPADPRSSDDAPPF